MRGFIKLSNQIINSTHIEKIIFNSEKYIIYMNSTRFNGFGSMVFSSIYTVDNYIEICKKKHINDYNIVDEWIKKIES